MDKTVIGSISEDEKFSHIIHDSPIAELAEYLGIPVEQAVKVRVDNAVETAKFKSMEITVRPFEPKDKLYGYASVKVSGITIDGFKIVENKAGELFVGYPSKKDGKSKTGYRNTVFVDKDFKDIFNERVMRAYHLAVEQTRSCETNLRQAPGKPERIAEQADSATKEAECHNATQPPREKSGKKHEAGRE